MFESGMVGKMDQSPVPDFNSFVTSKLGGDGGAGILAAIGPEKEVGELGVIGYLWKLYTHRVIGLRFAFLFLISVHSILIDTTPSKDHINKDDYQWKGNLPLLNPWSMDKTGTEHAKHLRGWIILLWSEFK